MKGSSVAFEKNQVTFQKITPCQVCFPSMGLCFSANNIFLPAPLRHLHMLYF